MRNLLFYIFAISCAFVFGAVSVLWVDSIRDHGQIGGARIYSAVPETILEDELLEESADAAERVRPEQTEPREIVIAAAPPSFVAAVDLAAPAVVKVYSSGQAPRNSGTSEFPGFPFDHPAFEDFFRNFGPNFGPGPAPQPEEGRALRSLGSGVVIDNEGYIVTNHHVIANSDNILIALPDGRRGEVEVIGSDPESDLALLKIEMANLPTVQLGRTADIAVGDWVLAIGNPYAVGQTVTQGIISAVGRNNVGVATYEDFIQTDAAINPGNSGGALINTKGELWGINTAIFSRSGGSHGIGFAIPVDVVLNVVEQLKNDGQVSRGWIGVYLNNLRAEDAQDELVPEEERRFRIQIAGLFPGGPAERGGLAQGDEILSINGRSFANSRELGAYVAEQPPGSEARVEYLRDGAVAEATVTLGRRPTANN